MKTQTRVRVVLILSFTEKFPRFLTNIINSKPFSISNSCTQLKIASLSDRSTCTFTSSKPLGSNMSYMESLVINCVIIKWFVVAISISSTAAAPINITVEEKNFGSYPMKKMTENGFSVHDYRCQIRSRCINDNTLELL